MMEVLRVRHGAGALREGGTRATSRARTLQRIDQLLSIAAVIDHQKPPAVANAARLLNSARSELGRAGGWFGGEFLAATRSVDAAEVELLRSAPLDILRGALPTVLHRACTELPPTDQRRTLLEDQATLDPARIDGQKLREVAINALTAANTKRQRALRRTHSLTLRLVAGVIAATALTMALAVLGAWSPALLSLCFRGTNGTVCPAGSAPSPFDIAVVEVLGLLGGSAVAALSLRTRRALPFPAATAARLLKLPAAALTAFGVLALIAGGHVPGLTALDTHQQIALWAICLGSAQQLWTWSIDRRVDELDRRFMPWADEPLVQLPGTHAAPHNRNADLPTIQHRYRLVCLSIMLPASIIGYAPVSVALNDWRPAAIAAAVTVVAALIGIKPSLAPRRRPPRVRTVAALVAESAVATAWAGLIVTGLYGTAVAVMELVHAMGGRQLPQDSIATPTAGVGAAVVALYAARRIRRRLGGQLRRPTGVGRQQDLQLGLGGELLVVLGDLLILLALAVAAITAPAAAPDLALFGQVLLVLLGLVVTARQTLALESLRSRSFLDDYRQYVQRSLEQLGYDVTTEPQVDSPEMDSLLRHVHLLAQLNSQCLAVQIRTGEQTDWRAASELLIAATALERYANRLPLQRGRDRVDVAPVMVFVGATPDDSLKKLAEEQSVHLFDCPPARPSLDDLAERFSSLRPAVGRAVMPLRQRW